MYLHQKFSYLAHCNYNVILIVQNAISLREYMKLSYLLTLIFCCAMFGNSAKIKMYALYTPSHQILVEKFFQPSLTDADIQLILIKLPEQTCHTAQFMREGWTKTTIQKIKLVLKAIDENWGEIFILSDVDIQFFGDFSEIIKTLMKGHDLLIQRDNPKGTLCSGFFVCRANEKTKKLFLDVLQLMTDNMEISDQKALNKFISRNEKTNQYDIVWDYLPEEYFFGGGTFAGIYWNEGAELYVPKKAVMHHANWVRGIQGKIKQLRYVHDIVKKNQKI